jgi:hypothetical protein
VGLGGIILIPKTNTKVNKLHLLMKSGGQLFVVVVVVETPFYLQSVYMHSANWCENWVLRLGEGHSLVPFRSY